MLPGTNLTETSGLFFSTNIIKKSAQSFFSFDFNSPASHYHIHAYTKPLKCIFFCSTFVCFNIDFWFSSKIAAIFSHHILSDEWWSESLWFEFSQCRIFIDRTHGIYIEIIQTTCSKRCENALNKWPFRFVRCFFLHLFH